MAALNTATTPKIHRVPKLPPAPPPKPVSVESVRPDTIDPEAFAELLAMLAYRRPYGDPTDDAFISRFIMPHGAMTDDFGNVYILVGEDPRVLWSSHTDTVHSKGGIQSVAVVEGGQIVLDDPASNCLGADCTTGVWLMIQMIRAGKEGLYVFHRGEECGCLGSEWIARNHADLLARIDYAIAFDRFGTDSVITHQAFGRCCSDEFATALGAQLGPLFQSDPGGTYTDTNEYVGIVPECTNISVGYYSQHSSRERQDIAHLGRLLPALLALDVDALPVVRDPNDTDEGFGSANRFYFDNTAFHEDDWDDDDLPGRDGLPQMSDYDGLPTLTNMVRGNPELVAEILHEYGFSPADVADEIYAKTGRIPS